MNSRLFASIAMAAGMSACSTPPAPVNMPPFISAAEMQPVSADPYSAIIMPAGEPVIAESAVARGEVIMTVPFAYRHTAVLSEDVTGFSITVKGTRIPAGAPGYFAGSFGSMGGFGRAGAQRDMWCFFRDAAAQEEREPLCLLRDDSGLAAIAPTRLSPYLWTSFSAMTGTFDYVHTPIFARRPVDMPVPLALEYRFDGWDRESGDAKVDLYIHGKQVRSLRARDNGEEPAAIGVLTGDILLTKVTGAPEQALARFRPQS